MHHRCGLGGSDGVIASIAGVHGHRAIVSTMEPVASGYEPGQDQSADVREARWKARSINSISRVDASEVSIDRRRTGIILMLAYQAVFRLVGPIQGVWDFGTVEVDCR